MFLRTARSVQLAMNFGMRPPEIISAQLYSGPGSELMMTAAAAWETLAGALGEAAAGYAAAIGQLARDCPDPATARALARHREWLDTLAARARQTAAHAEAAATAYEAAFAATVPPPAVEANRARRAALAATNFLGHTSADVADTDAVYEQMWAQDAAAMYAYAAASADAATVPPFAPPPAHRGETAPGVSGGWRVKAASDVVAAGRQVTAAIPDGLAGLSRSPLSSFDEPLLPVTASLSKLSSLSAPLDVAISHLNSLNKAAALRWMLPDPGGAGGAKITVRVGCGASVGLLTVPRGWTEPAPTTRGPARPLRRARVGEPIRLVAETEPPGQPSRRRPS